MDPETSAKLNQTPWKYPKENIQVSEHGENLKSRRPACSKRYKNCSDKWHYVEKQPCAQ
jgi:hypothetical protein